MARTGQRYRDQEAAEQKANVQLFANYLFRKQFFNQWKPYDDLNFGKLVITNERTQILLKPRSRQLLRGHVHRCTRFPSLVTTVRPDSTYPSNL
jgi:hypothetical protein